MHDVSIVFRIVSILLYCAAYCKCNVLSVYCCIVPLVVSAAYCECIIVLCHILYCCIVTRIVLLYCQCIVVLCHLLYCCIVLLYCAAPRFEGGEVTTGRQALSSICQNRGGLNMIIIVSRTDLPDLPDLLEQRLNIIFRSQDQVCCIVSLCGIPLVNCSGQMQSSICQNTGGLNISQQDKIGSAHPKLWDQKSPIGRDLGFVPKKLHERTCQLDIDIVKC